MSASVNNDKALRRKSSPAPVVGTVSVLGLSGPEKEKGAIGVGKSTLCNRMIRPNFVDFSTEHINCLSQADFLCSAVINAEHWLYWGEVELKKTRNISTTAGNGNSHANSGITHLRVIEQTVFLDDERFEPLGNAFSNRREKMQEDYRRMALSTRLESAGKIAYQNRDQLGQESDFPRLELPDGGRFSVDAFCLLFDVSFVPDRSSQHQSAVISSLLLAALKTKRPVFLVGTKFDQASAEGLAEWQHLLARKELKPVAQSINMVELSALEYVNVAELLSTIAETLERQRHTGNRQHSRILPYTEAAQLRRRQIEQIRSDFQMLLHSALPREEYLLQRGVVSWPRLLTHGNISVQPAYVRFVREFGPTTANNAYEEHMRASREWWFEHELSVRLPSLRDVLRRMFSRAQLCTQKWSQLLGEIERHPEFDTYFQPLGRSWDRLSRMDEQWDERLPGEILQSRESQSLFTEFQRELLDEIALERQADKLRVLLAQKEAVTPGRSFGDAKVMVEELGAFEQALPPGTALRIYEQHQEKLIQKAQHEFKELLQEHVELFVDIVVSWRARHPDLPPLIGLNGQENEAVHSILREHKRYRLLNGLPDLRSTAIGQFASFLSLPLERHCPAGSLCADLGASLLLQQHSQNSSTRFHTIELAIHGSAQLARLLLDSIHLHTANSSQLFSHNGLSVAFVPSNHKSHSSPQCHSSPSSPCTPASLATRIPSQLFLFSSAEEAEQHMLRARPSHHQQQHQQHHFHQHQLISRPSVGGLCPLAVFVCPEAEQSTPQGIQLQQMGSHLADQLGGIFKLLPYSASTSSPPGAATIAEDADESTTAVECSANHLELLLHELCTLQLDSGHSDLRVRVSSMCGDSFSMQSILAPLLDHTHLPIDYSGRKFWLDAHLPVDNGATTSFGGSAASLNSSGCSPHRDVPSPTPSLLAHRLPHHRCKARVCLSIGSFHHWLLAKWPLQSVQGHLLLFSPSRRASWRQARCAAKLLLDSVGQSMGGRAEAGRRHYNGDEKHEEAEEEEEEEEDQERRAMGRSIFLLAVSEPNTLFTDKSAARILTKAQCFAQRIGAMFASVRPNSSSRGTEQSQCFLEFFQRILQNPFPPADYYTITSRHIISRGGEGADDWHSIVQSRYGLCSTLTGSAETLMTERSDDVKAGDNCGITGQPGDDNEWAVGGEEGEEQRELLLAMMSTNNVQWRRRSKQSRIALVGSPPQRNSTELTGQPRQRKKMPPPVLRNDSQLSRTTANTQWTNASVLTASTLTNNNANNNGHRLLNNGEVKSRQNSDSTTRTPVASSSDEQRQQQQKGRDLAGAEVGAVRRREPIPAMRRQHQAPSSRERPQSAVLFSNSVVAQLPFADDSDAVFEPQQQQQKSAESSPIGVVDQRQRMLMMTSRASPAGSNGTHQQNQKQLQQQVSCSSRTPRKLEKLLSSFVQLRSTTPVLPLCDNATFSPADDSRRGRLLQRTTTEQHLLLGKAAVHPNLAANALLSPPSNHRRFQWLRSPCRSLSRGPKPALFHPIQMPTPPVDPIARVAILPPQAAAAAAAGTSGSSSQHSTNSPSTLSSSEASTKSSSEGTGGTQQKKPSKHSSNNRLADLCANNNGGGPNTAGLPPFLVHCVRAIEQNGGLETEGLYRVPGNQMDVERMFRRAQKRRERGGIDFSKIPVHAVATGLKRFLDGLMEPLIPEQAHQPILNTLEPICPDESNSTAAQTQMALLGQQIIPQLLVCVHQHLPADNRRVLHFLTEHLRRVANHAAANSMDLRNLAKVWTPTLFRPNFHSFEAMACFMAKFEMATLLLLANYSGGLPVVEAVLPNSSSPFSQNISSHLSFY